METLFGNEKSICLLQSVVVLECRHPVSGTMAEQGSLTSVNGAIAWCIEGVKGIKA